MTINLVIIRLLIDCFTIFKSSIQGNVTIQFFPYYFLFLTRYFLQKPKYTNILAYNKILNNDKSLQPFHLQFL